MRTAIIDDDQNIRKGTRRLLETLCPEVEIVGEADGVAAGIELLSRVNPELLFLDVEMGDGTGFDLLKKIGTPPFQVIFVTAHGHYAIPAIRFSATDFLLKPVDPDDLVLAVDRAMEKRGELDQQLQLQVLLDSLRPGNVRPQKLILKDSEKVYLVKVQDIIHCEADGRYTRFTLNAAPHKLVMSSNLKEYEQMLEPHGFVRCHHSHLVNTEFIVSLDKTQLTLLLSNGSEVPVSTRRKDALFNHF